MFRIKDVIKDKGLTIQEVADRLEISRVALSYQINGTPRLDTLQKIADVLEVDILDLFVDERPKELGLECPHCHNKIEITIK